MAVVACEGPPPHEPAPPRGIAVAVHDALQRPLVLEGLDVELDGRPIALDLASTRTVADLPPGGHEIVVHAVIALPGPLPGVFCALTRTVRASFGTTVPAGVDLVVGSRAAISSVGGLTAVGVFVDGDPHAARILEDSAPPSPDRACNGPILVPAPEQTCRGPTAPYDKSPDRPLGTACP